MTSALLASAPPASPPADAKDLWEADNDLGYIAAFIHERSTSTLDHHLACALIQIASEHAHCSNDCKVNHWFEDYPCDEYERGLSLGIAWLTDRVEKLEKPS